MRPSLQDVTERLRHASMAEGGLDAKVALAGAEIFVGEEDLRDGEAERGETALPGLHKQRLADGGAGLFSSQLAGAFAEAECAHAKSDGAGRNNDHFGAAGAERGDLRANGRDARLIKLADAVG